MYVLGSTYWKFWKKSKEVDEALMEDDGEIVKEWIIKLHNQTIKGDYGLKWRSIK